MGKWVWTFANAKHELTRLLVQVRGERASQVSSTQLLRCNPQLKNPSLRLPFVCGSKWDLNPGRKGTGVLHPVGWRWLLAQEMLKHWQWKSGALSSRWQHTRETAQDHPALAGCLQHLLSAQQQDAELDRSLILQFYSWSCSLVLNRKVFVWFFVHPFTWSNSVQSL